MNWLKDIIEEYCKNRSFSQRELLLTGKNYLKRIFSDENKRLKAFQELTNKDIDDSIKAKKEIEEKLSNKSAEEIELGCLSLKLHISKLKERTSILFIIGAMLALMVLALKIILEAVFIVAVILVAYFVLIERSILVSRIHSLEELLEYLEFLLLKKTK
jgi:hypothetical protein